MGTQVVYGEGERVVEEGADPEQVCVVCKGMLKLTTSSTEGRMLLLRIVGPGDVLGLAAALKGTQYEATAETLEECEVRVIGRAEFLGFMEEFQGVGANSAETVAREYEAAVLSARRLALSGSAAGRLASVLLEWGRRSARKSAVDDTPKKGEAALRFRMPLTHEELGNMAGISRETTTRVLSKLKGEGLIELEGERMVLLLPSKLERLYC
jgi:CRP/FNR family transcriptional regulator, cyclic AMP receptor protein